MRIISQNGNADIPYEKARIIHVNNDVVASVGADDYTMGVYSSKEKAYKAMEMVRKAYQQNQIRDKAFFSGFILFQFPKDDEIEV